MKYLVKIIPTSWIIYLWKKLPLPKWLRNLLVSWGNDRFLVAVLGIITNDEDKILLLHHTYREEPWGIPGGWTRKEQPKEGLKREIFEETGFKIEVEQLLSATYFESPTRMDLLYKGRYIGGDFRKNEEISDFSFFEIGNWPPGMPSSQKEMIIALLNTCHPN